MDLVWRAADPDLGSFVTAFVERRDEAQAGASLELPLTAPLLQFMLGADYALETGGRMESIPRDSFWAPSIVPRRSAPEGRLHVFVAVLTPAGAALLLGEGSGAGTILALEPVLRVRERGLPDALRAAGSFTERCVLVQALIRGRADAQPRNRSGSILAVAGAIAGHRLVGSVGDVARDCGMEERTLLNRFRRELGCSPKRYLRIARLNRLVRSLHPRPWGGKSAHDPFLEYHDASHLYREFRALTGLTPTAFVRSKTRSGDALVHSCLVDGAPG
jgi:AraC-like DNA-binding protein